MEKFLTKKPGKHVFLISILLLTVTSLLTAQNRDNLFQSVFGELPDSVQVFPVPLFVNNQYIFDLSLYSDVLNDHIDLEARKLLDFLKPRLQSITYENLEAETKKNESPTNNQEKRLDPMRRGPFVLKAPRVRRPG